MKTNQLVVVFGLGLGLAGLLGGCGGSKGDLQEIAYEGTTNDSAVVPHSSDTVSEGGNDEVIAPTGGSTVTGDTVSDFGDTGGSDSDRDEVPSPTDTPTATERFTCRNPEPLSGYEGIVHCIEGYCKNTASGKKLDCPYGIPEGSGPAASGTPTLRFPIPGLIERIPGRFLLLPAPVAVSQHDQDVSHLMNDAFQPNEFTDYETEVQGRIVAERNAIMPEEFRTELKSYVVAVLKALIDAQRNNGDIFRARTAKLAEVIAAFKSGDYFRSGSLVYDGELSHSGLFRTIPTNSDMVKKAGDYLEIQFAEVYKDVKKASLPGAGQEVREQSSLVQGGDGLNLVYKPGGLLDQGFNHIRDMGDGGDFWYEGSANWLGLADGIRSALIAARPVDPAAAAAVARELEEAGRSLMEQGERINDAITRW